MISEIGWRWCGALQPIQVHRLCYNSLLTVGTIRLNSDRLKQDYIMAFASEGHILLSDNEYLID